MQTGSTTLGRSLGLFSLGLGLAEVAMPRRMARMIGAQDDDAAKTALIAAGVRELAAGVGVLARPGRSAPLWVRLAGDALDLGMLAWFAKSKLRRPERLALAAAAVIGAAALDALAARRAARADGGVTTKAITTVTPMAEVVERWQSAEVARLLPELTALRSGEGTITFHPAPGNRGTEIRATVRGGILAGAALDRELRKLRQLLETGEIVRAS
jgi:hypothetical protein